MRNNYKNILSSIGNTPLIKLNKVVPKNSAEVWLKLESVNKCYEKWYLKA